MLAYTDGSGSFATKLQVLFYKFFYIYFSFVVLNSLEPHSVRADLTAMQYESAPQRCGKLCSIYVRLWLLKAIMIFVPPALELMVSFVCCLCQRRAELNWIGCRRRRCANKSHGISKKKAEKISYKIFNRPNQFVSM